MVKEDKTSKPTVQLIGQDGNVFNIMGKAVRAAKKAGWTQNKIDIFLAKMKGGDYNNALRVVQEYFDVF